MGTGLDIVTDVIFAYNLPHRNLTFKKNNNLHHFTKRKGHTDQEINDAYSKIVSVIVCCKMRY